MADRIAPKGGYLFEEKDKYRREVWSVFAKQTWPPCAKVGFMPSTEGAEIPIALDLGFKEENLYAIDRSAALLATAPWRKLYPGVKIYGTDVLRSGARLRNDGVQLDCMNMDLCSNLSQPMLDTFTGFINSGCHDGRIVVALTALCGRESTAVDTLANLLLSDSVGNRIKHLPKRVAVAFYFAVKTVHKVRINPITHGEYKSTNQKMAWAVGEFLTNDYCVSMFRDCYDALEHRMNNAKKILMVFEYLRMYGCREEFNACKSDVIRMVREMHYDITTTECESMSRDSEHDISLCSSYPNISELQYFNINTKFVGPSTFTDEPYEQYPGAKDMLFGDYGKKIGFHAGAG